MVSIGVSVGVSIVLTVAAVVVSVVLVLVPLLILVMVVVPVLVVVMNSSMVHNGTVVSDTLLIPVGFVSRDHVHGVAIPLSTLQTVIAHSRRYPFA
jgi:hypothetical protein